MMKAGLANKSKLMYRVMLAAAVTLFCVACSQMDEVPPAMRPLSKDAMHLLGNKGMSAHAPIFIRIFKEESELEVWKLRDDGHYYHFKTYPICAWSGELGPKVAQGDKQAPEGFYTITKGQMNPNSSYYLSFNIGFPNAYDRAHNRSGQFLMVHGDCRSAGCYAMTDGLIEEIYGLMRESFTGGQEAIYVHAYPFRMSEENMRRHSKGKWTKFWRQLKEGYDYFEIARVPPSVDVCENRYLVNAKFVQSGVRPKPTAACPQFVRPTPEVFAARASEIQLASERVVVPGRKTRGPAQTPDPSIDLAYDPSRDPTLSSAIAAERSGRWMTADGRYEGGRPVAATATASAGSLDSSGRMAAGAGGVGGWSAGSGEVASGFTSESDALATLSAYGFTDGN
ncbi:MAG: murein L,D-transpeptidase family protein [Hyphomicrobiaceae bacterium]